MNATTVIPEIDFTRISNDVNGNPRYVCHFTDLLTDKDREDQKAEAERLIAQGKIVWYSVVDLYPLAIKRANKIGGRKYHTKGYGGGIVFQSYSLPQLNKSINEIKGIVL